jgi:hypothetical protein
MDFRGIGLHRPDVIEDQCCRQSARRYGAYDIDSTQGDSWEAPSSLLVGRQRDLSSAAGIIDYSLSYRTIYLADILHDKQFYRKTGALGPIEK